MTIDNTKIEIPKVTFDKNGNLEIVASPTSSKNDFDFFAELAVLSQHDKGVH